MEVQAFSTTADNKITITGGKFNSFVTSIFGGYAFNTSTGNQVIENNEVEISGDNIDFGTSAILIAAGYYQNKDSEVNNNKITLSGRYNLNNATLAGYYSSTETTKNHSGNTLNLNGWSSKSGNNSIYGILNFDVINLNSVDFDNPITVIGGLSLDNTKINVSSELLSAYDNRISSTDENAFINNSYSTTLLQAANGAIYTDNNLELQDVKRYFSLNKGQRKIYSFYTLEKTNDKKIVLKVSDDRYSALRYLRDPYDLEKISFEAQSDFGKNAGRSLTFHNWSSSNNKIKAISGFDTVHFIEQGISNPIRVSDNLDFAGTKVKVSSVALASDSEDSLNLLKGDLFHIIKAENTYVKTNDEDASGDAVFTIGTGIKGVGTYRQVDDGIVFDSTSCRTGNCGIRAQKQTHGILMSFNGAQSVALTNASVTYEGAVSKVKGISASGFLPMINIGVSNICQQTGSDVKVKALSLAFGTGYRVDGDSFSAVYGIGTEHTTGNFRNNFDAGYASPYISNKGKIKTYGAVLSADYDFINGLHVNTALRYGKSRSTMDSGLYDPSAKTTYSTDLNVPYYSVLLGGGYIYALTDQLKLDTSASYLFTRMKGTSFNAGGYYKLNKTDSQVTKLSEKLTYNLSKMFDFYVSIAYRREFDGEDTGTYTASGATVNLTPTITKGNSYQGDFGTVIRPFKDDHLILDCGISGFTGKLKGYSANISGKYIF